MWYLEPVAVIDLAGNLEAGRFSRGEAQIMTSFDNDRVRVCNFFLFIYLSFILFYFIYLFFRGEGNFKQAYILVCADWCSYIYM